MTGHTWLGIWVSRSEVLRDNIFKLCWTQATVQGRSDHGPNPGDGCFFSVTQVGSGQPVLMTLVETRDKGVDKGEIPAPRDPRYLGGACTHS